MGIGISDTRDGPGHLFQSVPCTPRERSSSDVIKDDGSLFFGGGKWGVFNLSPDTSRTTWQ